MKKLFFTFPSGVDGGKRLIAERLTNGVFETPESREKREKRKKAKRYWESQASEVRESTEAG